VVIAGAALRCAAGAPSRVALLLAALLAPAAGRAQAPAPPAAPTAPTPALQPFRAGDWQIRQGAWRFTADGEVVSEGRGRSALLYHATARPRDLDFTVAVMFLGPESSAGLVFRGAGAPYGRETFYQFEWYTRGSHHDRRLSLMVKNPRWKQIVTPRYPEAPLNRWILLRVRVVGDQIECFVDGRRVFARRDRTYLRAGRVGLHVWQPRAVRFRGFRLTAPET
jgi:hypothetical protein